MHPITSTINKKICLSFLSLCNYFKVPQKNTNSCVNEKFGSWLDDRKVHNHDRFNMHESNFQQKWHQN